MHSLHPRFRYSSLLSKITKSAVFPLLADETGFHPALEAVFDFKYSTTLVDATPPGTKKYIGLLSSTIGTSTLLSA